MWWFKLILLISITITVTWFIVWGLSWVDKNRTTYPELYKNKGTIRFVLWLLLSSGDFPK